VALNKYQKAAQKEYLDSVTGGRGKVEIEGLRQLNKTLKDFSKATREELKEVHREAGQIVVDGALRIVPFRTGRLAASLKSNPTMKQGRVRIGDSSVPYAGAIHFGWAARNIQPNPFVYDVLDDRRQAVYNAYAEGISKLIIKYDLD
jgi:hypothetical protein